MANPSKTTKIKVRKKRSSGRKRGNPRLLAVKALSKWLASEPGQRPELEVLGDKILGKATISEKDKALYWNILIGTVRWLRLIRWHLDRYLKRFSKLPQDVQAALLTGGYQIIFLSRVPYFSAVNESVEIVRTLGHSWASGLVNASLRNLARGNKVIPESTQNILERCAKGFENCVANLTSHPHWMVKRWSKRWGHEICASVCMNNNLQPPLVLRVNTLKISVEDFLELLNKSGFVGERCSISPVGVILHGHRGGIDKIPGFKQGYFQVQDEASQLVGLLLAPHPGQKILDVCAGVGGKTTLLAQLIQDKGEIVACDVNSSRLALLKENLARLGIGSVKVTLLDHEGEELIKSSGPYDRVLIDAPCSGLGVIRRHPDIKWNRIPPDIESLSKVQENLLQTWSKLVRPGAVLVFSVCTLEEEETFEIVENFLEKNKDFSLRSASSVVPGLPQDIIQKDMVRVYPGSYGMDGFFVSVLEKSN